MSEQKKDVLTKEEAAAFLRISVRSMTRRLGRREIPGRRIGGQWRFSRAALERFLSQREAS